jgi:hypothetical protein
MTLKCSRKEEGNGGKGQKSESAAMEGSMRSPYPRKQKTSPQAGSSK